MWIRQPGYAYKQPKATSRPRPAGQPSNPDPYEGKTLPPELTTMTPNAVQWQRVQIPLVNRDILGPGGVILNPINPAVPGAHNMRGGFLIQHMDEALALAWIAEARRQINMSVIAAQAKEPMDPGVDPTNDNELYDALHPGQVTQMNRGAMANAAYAIMQAYNALNIPWYMDPEARSLYRQYVAGQPSSTLAEFGQYNYSNDWFTPNSIFPGFGSSSGRGYISAETSQLAKAVYGSDVPLPGWSLFGQVPQLWPALRDAQPVVGAPSMPNPAYALHTQNMVVFRSFVDESRSSTLLSAVPVDANSMVDLNALSSSVGPVGWAMRDWEVPYGADLSNHLDALHPQYGIASLASWKIFSYTPTNPLQNMRLVTTPLIFYVAWLDHWVSSLAARAPQDIVIAARAYTVYCNASQAVQYGGESNFIQKVINLPAFITAMQVSGELQNNMRLAASVVGSIGAAAAPETVGISAIIGGAAAMAIDVGSTLVRNRANDPKDEFGRYKPLLERGWLSGFPWIEGDQGNPQFGINGPPGWVRPAAPGSASPGPIDLFHPGGVQAALAEAQRKANQNNAAPPIPPVAPAGASTGLGTVAALAAGAGAVLLGYKVLTGKKKTSTRR